MVAIAITMLLNLDNEIYLLHVRITKEIHECARHDKRSNLSIKPCHIT